MLHPNTSGLPSRSLNRGRHAVHVGLIATLIGFLALIPTFAATLLEPWHFTKFAGDYYASTAVAMTLPGITYPNPEAYELNLGGNRDFEFKAASEPLFASSRVRNFETLIRTDFKSVPGGIFQSGIAQPGVGVSNRTITVEYHQEAKPDYRFLLRIGDQTYDTDLTDSQALQLILWVNSGNAAVASFGHDVLVHKFPNGSLAGATIAQLAYPYLDTPDGYYLLWGDKMSSRDSHARPNSDGITVVDPEEPAIVEVAPNGLRVRGYEPRIASWRKTPDGGEVVGYETLENTVRPRSKGDTKALQTMLRFFKWAPVIRLAHSKDPEAFSALAQKVKDFPIDRRDTPRVVFQPVGEDGARFFMSAVDR
jgi:hypothetical protein